PDKDRTVLAKQFTDGGTVDYYGISYVLAITKQKIMNGMPNPLLEGEKKPTYSFNPKSNLNRADMSIISYNVMKKLKKI
ncbi:MAG: S-layer homology domain-containing protein, partial [Bacilli bacterium]